MKKRRVKFLQYFNGPYLILFFDADNVAVAFILFILIFSSFMVAGMPLAVIVIAAIFLNALLTWAYIKAKEGASGGYLKHWFYINKIWSVKENPKKFKEVDKMDCQDYFPPPDYKQFID